MKGIIEYLSQLGFTPFSVLLLIVGFWFVAQYVSKEFSIKKKQQELFLETESTRDQTREEIINELHGLSNSYNHCIESLLESRKGEREKYFMIMEDSYQRIRGLARKKGGYIEPDYPYFLTRIYAFTDHGKRLLKKEVNYDAYREARDNAYTLFDEIRKKR